MKLSNQNRRFSGGKEGLKGNILTVREKHLKKQTHGKETTPTGSGRSMGEI